MGGVEYPIDKTKTALLIIDPQKVYSDPTSPLYCKNFDSAITNINLLSKAMREECGSGTVILVKHVYDANKTNVGRLGDFGIADLWNETNELSKIDTSKLVGDKKNDILITKTRYSAFVKTELEELLKSKGIDTVIVTGFMTQFCVTTTTRHGHDLDFKVITPCDANDGPDLPDTPIDSTKQVLNASWNIAVADTSTTQNTIDRMK